MDGAAVIIHLLSSDPGIRAIIDPILPEGAPPRISADPLGQHVTLPAIRVMTVSATDRNILTPGVRRRVTERIQVEAHAEAVPQVKALRRAIRHACADALIAELVGLTRIVVHTDGAGPQGMSPDTMARMAPQDFKVSYNEER